VRSLFLTYDGLLSPLGQSQILPYMRGLRRRGHAVVILSFEQTANAATAAQHGLRQELEAEGIIWQALRYHKRPTVPATGFDIAQGVAAARLLISRHQIEVLHARSYVPMLMALLAAGKQRLIFDMRGFWADERVDGNLWNRQRPAYDLLYRLAKGLERWGLRRADHVVLLTRAAARVLPDIPSVSKPLPPVTVIPTCVDLDRFQPLAEKPARRRDLGLPSGRILVYQGSIGTWYLLPEMVAFIKKAKERWPDLLWLVLAPGEHDLVRRVTTEAGLAEGRDFRLQSLKHKDVPRWLSAADAALFFIKPSYSKISSCPTKFGECLASGLPVVANDGVGDVADTIDRERVGAVVHQFNESAYAGALETLEALLDDPKTAMRCRRAAEVEFDLAEAITRYDGIYTSLGE
jgi:glycosyltransferase involved in cell wall biosynthesis